MAEEKVNEMQIFFPFRGLNDSFAYKDQIPLTTSIMANCKIRDVSENRARGGQRGGLNVIYERDDSTLGQVLKIVSFVNTYINPEMT